MVQNGRFANAPLLQLLLMFGKGVFSVLNTGIFLVFIASFLALINASARRIYNSACVLFVAAVWFFIPVFNEGFLWVSGALNYLWAVTFGLLFLVLFRKLAGKTGRLPLWKIFLCCGFSLVAGWMHEAVSIGISAALVVHALLNRKRLSREEVFVGLAFIAGTALVVFAPGTLNRGAGVVNLGNLPMVFIKSIFGVRFLLRSPICLVLIFVGIVAFFRNRSALFDFAKKNIFMVSALVALTGFFCFLGGSVAPRGLTAYTMFALILLFSLPQISTVCARIFSLVAIPATLASAALVLPQMKTNCEINEAFFAAVDAQRTEIVVFDGFETREGISNAGRYLVSYDKGLFPQRRLFYLTRFFNREPFWLFSGAFLSKIYEKDDFCVAENEVGSGFFANEAFPFLVRKATAQDFENRSARPKQSLVYSYKINEEKTSSVGKIVAWALEKLSVLKRRGEYRESADAQALVRDEQPPSVIKCPSGYYQIALVPYDLWERFSSYGLRYEITGVRVAEE